MYINNTTTLSQSQTFILPCQKGIDTLHCLIQATFRIRSNGELRLCETQMPIQEENGYWHLPNNSSLKTPGVVHSGKAATDILMTGFACAKGQAEVSALKTGINIGGLEKEFYVFGDRYWHKGQRTQPKLFRRMPFIYENAFGGAEKIDGIWHVDPRNPVGKGYTSKPTRQSLEGCPLPNIEDPNHLIEHYQDQPSPAGFGPVAPHWQARTQYAGTYDEAWRRRRAPFTPDDYNPRFQNTAHPDLIYIGFLQGGEPVEITGMHPSGRLAFSLPIIALAGNVSFSGKPSQPLSFVIDTLHLHPNNGRFTMTWRAICPVYRDASRIHQIDIAEVQGSLHNNNQKPHTVQPSLNDVITPTNKARNV